MNGIFYYYFVIVGLFIFICILNYALHRREIFSLMHVVQSNWEILVFPLASLILVIGSVQGTHLWGHLAGMPFLLG